jgi:hypothetical protein
MYPSLHVVLPHKGGAAVTPDAGMRTSVGRVRATFVRRAAIVNPCGLVIQSKKRVAEATRG